jgi:hypothetical protein
MGEEDKSAPGKTKRPPTKQIIEDIVSWHRLFIAHFQPKAYSHLSLYKNANTTAPPPNLLPKRIKIKNSRRIL